MQQVSYVVNVKKTLPCDLNKANQCVDFICNQSMPDTSREIDKQEATGNHNEHTDQQIDVRITRYETFIIEKLFLSLFP